MVFGESAGANLTALAGLAHDPALFRQGLADAKLDPQLDLKLQGVIALYPPVDFMRIDAMLADQGCPTGPGKHSDRNGMEPIYLGAALTEGQA